MPEGEAHRHEPPIPHDEVMVDTRKNNAELEEDKKQPAAPAGGDEQEEKHAVKLEDQKEDKGEEKPKPVEPVVRKEEVDLGGGEVQSNEVLEKQGGEAGMKRDVPQLKPADKIDQVKDSAVEQADKVDNPALAVAKREYSPLFSCNSVPEKCSANLDFVIFGDPSAALPEGEHHPAADEGPPADGKDAADEKMDGEWRRKLWLGF